MSSRINSSIFKSSSLVHLVLSRPYELSDPLEALLPDLGFLEYFFLISSNLFFFSLAYLASSSLLKISDLSSADR